MWSRNRLVWALALSLLVHVCAAPFVSIKAQARPAPERPGRLHIDVVYLPKPKPKPTPTPKPVVVRPIAVHAIARRPIAVHVVATQHVRSATQSAYVAPRVSSRAPGEGIASTDPGPAGLTPSSDPGIADPTSAPSPTPSPKPACANPNVDAALAGAAVEPEFSENAREQGATGTAQIAIDLDASGNVVGARVAHSTGNSELDRAALDAARTTHYSPAIVDCVKTPGTYLFRADFETQ